MAYFLNLLGLMVLSWLKVNLAKKRKMVTVITQFIKQNTQTNQQAVLLEAIFTETYTVITHQSWKIL